ncbi:hypothetical protein HJ178_24800, partial [Vibrio parahaemolyticus]|nr:hypothetical protein [Vibrio parahaemolyticus]
MAILRTWCKSRPGTTIKQSLECQNPLTKKDREIANKVVVGLNKRYGDENFTGVSHPFRMAGFSNKKLTR